MGYRLGPKEPVQGAVRRIAREQLDKALGELDNASVDPHETVHRVRKRLKKLRGLVRLVRKSFDDYSRVNEAARDAARRVSALRDAKVHVDVFGALVEPHGGVVDLAALEPIRRALVAHRDLTARAQLVEEDRLRAVRADLVELRDDAEGWKLDDEGWDAVRKGLRKTYGRARDAMEDAYESRTPEGFHQWRKRVKYHRNHVRLLRELWEAPLDALRGELKTLSDRLGDAHDLDELLVAVEERAGEPALAEPRRVLIALAERRRAELRRAARPLGEKLFAPDEDVLAERFGALWRAA